MSSKPAPLRIEVFRPGSYRSVDGRTYEYTNDRIDRAIKNFDPKKFRPPAIVTPAMDHNHAPYDERELHRTPLAHGVPSKIERDGDRVYATFEKYTPHFAEWIEQGRIPGISTAFYLENDPGNPNPGEPTFKHFAGVLFPSVKGMAMPGFSEPSAVPSASALIDAGAEELTDDQAAAFSEVATETIVDSLYRLRDWLLESESRETAEALLPLDSLRLASESLLTDRNRRDADFEAVWQAIGMLSRRLNDQPEPVAFSEPTMPEDAIAPVAPLDPIDPTPDMTNPTPTPVVEPTESATPTAPDVAAFSEIQDRAATLEKENEALRQRLAELERDRVRAEVAAFCEPLPDDLKQPVTLGEKSVALAEFAEALPETDRAFLREWIGQIREAIAQPDPKPEPEPTPAAPSAMFSEVTGDASRPIASGSAQTPMFSEYDADSQAYAAKVSAYAREHNLSYDAASRALRTSA